MDYPNHITNHEKGKHLTYEDYVIIELRLKDGWKPNAIAKKELNCSANTVRNIIKKGMTPLYNGKVFRFKAKTAWKVYQENGRHSCPITVFPEVSSQHIGLQLLPISCGEQPLFPFLRLHLQELLQGSVGHGRQIQGSASARFGNIRTDEDGLRFGIVVLISDCHEFACPNARVEHKQHNVVVPKFSVIVLIQSP